MPWRGCGDGTGNSKGMLHLTFEQFVVICGMTGREGKTEDAELIVVENQELVLPRNHGSDHFTCFHLSS